MKQASYSDRHLRVLEKQVINCGDVLRLLADYTEADLPSSLKARLGVHIGQCPACRELARSYEWIIELAGQLGNVPVPSEVQDRLRQALNARLGLQLPRVN